MKLHSTYKSRIEVHEVEGGFQAYLHAEPNPEGGKVDWSKPQKVLNGPTCPTPEKAISVFLRNLQLAT